MKTFFTKGYIPEGVILTLAFLFYVPKGSYDICLVFDATTSRLNCYLWDPNFIFTLMGSFLMMVGTETDMVDLDVGEMFYSFLLSLVLDTIVDRI